ncbi:hypothetical protein [Chondromyces crocatus]|uniref:Uncharacterized protein n=1 Tax=Chondromyces crocatus TaxID=52 RepID=A0A0K1ECT5_CHOCO|nr:hypothetical protein [Chondromyces crocatus]AKT38681.1 uncharacterized protein CMC5_028290 [Chondromyces crocatus]
MKISQPQLDTFAQTNPAIFTEWLIDHVHRFFADCCDELGPETVRLEVHEAIQRAAHHGFVEPLHIARYTDMVFEFGTDFDDDPRFPWAAQILADPALSTPAERMERLHAAALDQVTRDAQLVQPDADSPNATPSASTSTHPER